MFSEICFFVLWKMHLRSLKYASSFFSKERSTVYIHFQFPYPIHINRTKKSDGYNLGTRAQIARRTKRARQRRWGHWFLDRAKSREITREKYWIWFVGLALCIFHVRKWQNIGFLIRRTSREHWKRLYKWKIQLKRDNWRLPVTGGVTTCCGIITSFITSFAKLIRRHGTQTTTKI